MDEILNKISNCVEFGKINKDSKYPPSLIDQDGAIELTRKALDATRESINLSRKVRELEMLPRATFIINVQSDLIKWNKEFQDSIIALQSISSKDDKVGLKSIAQKGLKSPKGLINKYMYEHCPNRLAVIWVTGAQYYYNANE